MAIETVEIVSDVKVEVRPYSTWVDFASCVVIDVPAERDGVVDPNDLAAFEVPVEYARRRVTRVSTNGETRLLVWSPRLEEYVGRPFGALQEECDRQREELDQKAWAIDWYRAAMGRIKGLPWYRRFAFALMGPAYIDRIMAERQGGHHGES